MLKKLVLISALAAAMGAGAMPAAADPSGCNCVWMATGYNMETKEFTYEWVCPTNPICNEQVEP